MLQNYWHMSKFRFILLLLDSTLTALSNVKFSMPNKIFTVNFTQFWQWRINASLQLNFCPISSKLSKGHPYKTKATPIIT